jgi:hypothetical protein
MVGPLLWAVSTQLGPIWPGLECGAANARAAVTCFVFAVASLAASIVSWRSATFADPNEVTAFPHSITFIAKVAALMGVFCAFVLALQGLADVVLDACLR